MKSELTQHLTSALEPGDPVNNDNQTTVLEPEANPFAERAAALEDKPKPEQPIDLVGPFKRLQETAQRMSDTPFREGYLMAIAHAIELAQIMQQRLDMRLEQEQLTK